MEEEFIFLFQKFLTFQMCRNLDISEKNIKILNMEINNKPNKDIIFSVVYSSSSSFVNTSVNSMNEIFHHVQKTINISILRENSI